MLTTYQEIALLLMISAGLGLLGLRLRQPLIVVFILVGLLVGPAGLGLVRAHDPIDRLAQTSEFSIFFVALRLVGLVTITLSTYMILYSSRLYLWVGPWLGVFERRRPYREMALEQRGRMLGEARVVVLGMGRLGRRLAALLHRTGMPLVGVDFDPEPRWSDGRRRLISASSRVMSPSRSS